MYLKGEIVNVINSTMSGTLFLEGTATIVKAVDPDDSRYLVQFTDGFGGPVERFVDPLAQEGNVGAYLDRLNDPT